MNRYDNPEVRYTYRSPLIDRLREGGALTCGRVTVEIPSKFGFCWGVDRALAMIADARSALPNRPMWLLNQVIHNPFVNEDMYRSGVDFLKGPRAVADMPELSEEDVVIIPAFSASVEEMAELEQTGCKVVDTTCPWVLKPHKRVQTYIEDGLTTVIHGTVGHDETRATCSLIAHHGGKYLVVYDMLEAESLASVLRGDAPASELLNHLRPGAASSGFNPETDLKRIGIVNQTTMLASESRAIAATLRSAIEARQGYVPRGDRFRDFDTICRATQQNQDAAGALAAGEPDVMLVVGGYDSSNTRNLARVGDRSSVPTFHIEGPDCVGETEIAHRDRRTGEILTTSDWLKAGPVRAVFTAGASTPDTILGEVITRVVIAAGERLPEELLIA